MTAIERVRRTQRILGAAALTKALAWGLAATLAIVAAASFLRDDTTIADGIGVALGVGIAAVLMWRSRHFISANRVALWIEEKIPALQYSLVTAVEQSGSAFADGMERAVAREDVGGITLASLRRSLLAAVTALVAATLLLYVSPSTGFGRAEIGRAHV